MKIIHLNDLIQTCVTLMVDALDELDCSFDIAKLTEL